MKRFLALAVALSLGDLTLPAAEDDAAPDLDLIPADSFAFATLRLGEVSASPAFKMLEGAMKGLHADFPPILERLEKATGIAASSVERLTIAARRTSHGPVVILRTSKPYGREAIVKKLGKAREAKIAGKDVIVATDNPGLEVVPAAFWLVNDRTIVVAEEESFAENVGALSAWGKGHPLAEARLAAAGKHALVLAGRPELFARVLDAEEGGRHLPEKAKGGDPKAEKKEPRPEKEKEGARERRAFLEHKKDAEKRPFKLRTLDEALSDPHGMLQDMEVFPLIPLARCRSCYLTLDLGKDGLALRGLGRFASADEAGDARTVLAMSLLVARELVPIYLRREMGADPAEPRVAAFLKAFRATTRAVKLEVDGGKLTVAADASLDVAPLVKLLAAEAPKRKDANNIKQIAIAFHNYESSFGHLPQRALCGPGDKPLLSWRVAILPFIEQEALYRQFKLDEPWDSDHNKKLIGKMPEVYKAPARAAAGPGETFYQVFAGPKTLFPTPAEKVRFTHILDGTSNTFLLAEAGKSVPWTKPEDIEITDKMLPKLGGQFETFLHIAMCDGSVRRVSRKAPEKSLRIYIDPKDGLVLPDDIGP
jgi:hypothetical protein